MTDRVKGFTVTLEKDYRIDDVEGKMKELKWAIKRNTTNFIKVNAWGNKKQPDQKYRTSEGYMHSNGLCRPFIHEGYEEITFERFNEITNNNGS